MKYVLPALLVISFVALAVIFLVTEANPPKHRARALCKSSQVRVVKPRTRTAMKPHAHKLTTKQQPSTAMPKLGITTEGNIGVKAHHGPGGMGFDIDEGEFKPMF